MIWDSFAVMLLRQTGWWKTRAGQSKCCCRGRNRIYRLTSKYGTCQYPRKNDGVMWPWAVKLLWSAELAATPWDPEGYPSRRVGDLLKPQLWCWEPVSSWSHCQAKGRLLCSCFTEAIPVVGFESVLALLTTDWRWWSSPNQGMFQFSLWTSLDAYKAFPGKTGGSLIHRNASMFSVNDL